MHDAHGGGTLVLSARGLGIGGRAIGTGYWGVSALGGGLVLKLGG